MAVVATHIGSKSSDSGATSFATDSVSLSANKLVLLTVYNQIASGTANEPTVTGASRTWTKVITLAGAGATSVTRITVYRSLSGSANSGALTIDYAGQTNTNHYASVEEFENVDTSGTNGANAIVQSVSQEGVGSTTGLTVTLAAFSYTNSATFGAMRFGAASNPTSCAIGSGFTQLAHVQAAKTLNVEWKNSGDTSVDWTWSTTSLNCLGVGIEIKCVNTYAQSLSDTFTSSESLSKTSAYIRSLSDAFTSSEAIVKSINYIRSVTDTFTSSDVFSKLWTIWTKVSETVSSWSKKTPTSASYTKKTENSSTWTKDKPPNDG